VSPPIRNRVHTAPNLPRTTSSAWRYVPTPPARRNSSNLSTQTTARQTIVPQSQSPLSTAGIEASLNQLEKDFQEGEKNFTQAFNTLKREVIRLLAEAKSTSANTSASPSAGRDAHGHLQCGASRSEDTDTTSLLRIPGAFDSSSNNASTPSADVRGCNYRYNVWCDFCGRGIRGTRAKCNNCADYDLVCCLLLLFPAELTHDHSVRGVRTESRCVEEACGRTWPLLHVYVGESTKCCLHRSGSCLYYLSPIYFEDFSCEFGDCDTLWDCLRRLSRNNRWAA
jgi:hypothetical protein